MSATAAPVSIGELAEQVEGAVKDAYRLPALDTARAAAREAGLGRARHDLADCPERIEAAQATYRDAQQAERVAKDAYEAALVEAEWGLDGHFVTEGAKTFLVTGGEGPDAESNRKQMTAAERSAWKKAEATKQPIVRDALKALHAAESERQAAADAVSLEERRFTACRVELEAAIAQLSALATALKGGTS